MVARGGRGALAKSSPARTGLGRLGRQRQGEGTRPGRAEPSRARSRSYRGYYGMARPGGRGGKWGRGGQAVGIMGW